jgi:SAM-dependent methyltransferase
MTNTTTLLSQIDKIRDFEKGHRAVQILNTGFQCGILNGLAETSEGFSVPELAVKLMLYEPFLKIWCQTAYHFEILDGDNLGRFRLQPFLEEALGLNRFSEKDLTGIGQTVEGQDPFVSYLRTGRFPHLPKSALSSMAISRATKSTSTLFLSMIFPQHEDLRRRLEEGCGFLDVGCGSGTLLIELARVFKKGRFVGIDPDPYGVETAETSIAHLGLEDRVRFENMGGEEILFHQEFEMAGLVLTLHEILSEVRLEALKKIGMALKPSGTLLILDYPYPSSLEEFRNPRYEYGIIEQYFEALGGIVHINREEQDDLLRKAGFTGISRMAVGDGGKLDFITARK